MRLFSDENLRNALGRTGQTEPKLSPPSNAPRIDTKRCIRRYCIAEREEQEAPGRRGGILALGVVIAVVLAVVTVGVVGLWGFHWVTTSQAECRVGVLMFHSVAPDTLDPSRYTMREGDFESQMRELQSHQIPVIDLEELLEFIGTPRDADSTQCPYPEGAVLLTFDMDGTSYHAETILDTLLGMEMPAIFFVPTGFIDEGSAVSSEDIRAFARENFEFGSHTEWHRDMRRVEPHELTESLQRSRSTLEELTGRTVRSIAAPGGRFDSDVVTLVRNTGFEAFFNSDPCVITPAHSPFHICRIEIRGDRGLRSIHSVTSSWRVATQATAWDLKRGIEGVLGDRGWRWLHQVRETLGS